MGFLPPPRRRRWVHRSGPPGFTARRSAPASPASLAALRLARAGIPFVVPRARRGRRRDVAREHLSGRRGRHAEPPLLVLVLVEAPRLVAHFASRDEIAAYVRQLADTTACASTSASAPRSAPRYDEDGERWHVLGRDRGGHERRSIAQPCSAPSASSTDRAAGDLPGLDDFTGAVFHSAAGRHDADLPASVWRWSAPARAPCRSYRRSPTRSSASRSSSARRSGSRPTPSTSRRSPSDVHWLMDHVPFYRVWYRFRLSWTCNDRVHPSLQIDPEWPHPERSLNAVNDGAPRATSPATSRRELAGRARPDREVAAHTTRRSASACCSTTAGSRR